MTLGSTKIYSDVTNHRVGIGTETPGEKLTVNGTIESISGGIKFPDGTTQSTAASGSELYCTQAIGTTDISNSSTSFVDMAYMQVDIAGQGRFLLYIKATNKKAIKGSNFFTM